MKEIIAAAVELVKNGEDFSLATVISRDGSAPRGPGAKMLVRQDGSIVGTVGGGLVEAEVISCSVDCIAAGRSEIKKYILSEKNKSGLDMTCGGEARVLIQFVDSDSAAAFIDGKSYLVTQAVLQTDGSLDTGLRFMNDDELDEKEPYYPFLREAFDKSSSYRSFFPNDETVLIIEAMQNQNCVYICGGGHVGLKTAELAYFAGFDTVVIDDREEFANSLRFTFARDTLVVKDYLNVFESFKIDRRSFIVILTRGHSFDKEVLQQALATDAFYIGMIGSRGKIRKIYDSLQAAGVSEAGLNRVSAPIGLPIKAETPAEIAVSIVSQLIEKKADA